MSYIDPDCLPQEKIKYLSADGSSAACFRFKESKDAEPEEFKKASIVPLGVWRGNSCWGGPNTAFPDQKGVICKSHDARQPAQRVAVLNDNEEGLLMARGWTGDCSTCGLAKEKGNREFKPEMNVVALWKRDGKEPEVVLLTFKGWRSFFRVRDFLGRLIGKNPHDYEVTVEMRKQRSSDGGSFSEPFFGDLKPVAEEHREAMQDLADRHVNAIRHRAPRSDNALSAPSSRPSLPPPPPLVEADDIPF